MLLVLVPMVLLSSTHIHPLKVRQIVVGCEMCVDNVVNHSHISDAYHSQEDVCLMCNFLSSFYVMTAVVAAVMLILKRLYVDLNNRVTAVEVIGVIRLVRGPPCVICNKNVIMNYR